LWQVAGAANGGADTLPFATRIHALRRWWLPRPGDRQAPLCARCGRTEPAGASHHGAPFCSHCVKDPSLSRAHAVAPAERGTWWIRCQVAGCRNVFVARAQARRCPRCRLAQTSPARRRSLRSAK
jgi:hypothetical protein